MLFTTALLKLNTLSWNWECWQLQIFEQQLKWERFVKFLFEFSLNVSLNSLISVTKIFVITVKGFETATSCVRDWDATTVPARHMWGTGSLNWAQVMLQRFIRFQNSLNSLNSMKVLLHLGKTPLFSYKSLCSEYGVDKDQNVQSKIFFKLKDDMPTLTIWSFHEKTKCKTWLVTEPTVAVFLNRFKCSLRLLAVAESLSQN